MDITSPHPKEFLKFLTDNHTNSNLYVRFSEINKWGINPSSKYNTPLGIYTYPIKNAYVYAANNNFPFADSAKYIQILKAKSPDKLAYSSKYDKKQLYEDLNKILRKTGFPPNYNNINDLIEEVEYTTERDHPFVIFLYTTNILDKKLRIANRPSHKPYKRNVPRVSWSGMLSELYEGLVDDDGTKGIHEAEPFQAVFFNKGALKLVDVFEQSPKKHEQSPKKQKAANQYTIKHTSISEQLSSIKRILKYQGSNAVKILEEYFEFQEYLKGFINNTGYDDGEVIFNKITVEERHAITQLLRIILHLTMQKEGDENFVMIGDPELILLNLIDYIMVENTMYNDRTETYWLKTDTNKYNFTVLVNIIIKELVLAQGPSIINKIKKTLLSESFYKHFENLDIIIKALDREEEKSYYNESKKLNLLFPAFNKIVYSSLNHI